MKGNFRLKALGILCALAGVVIESASAATISVSWDASPSADVVGYAVYYGYSSGDYSTRTDAGNQTTLTFQGLDERTDYFFVATAYTADGLESLPSNEVKFLSEISDTTAPQIVPTSSAFTTISNAVRLSGSASDDIAVVSITWSNRCNQVSGNAAGTSGWTIDSVPLCVGTNVIAIRAEDSSGNYGNAIVTIVRVVDCTYAISSSAANFTSGGGGGSVNVVTDSSCSWNASSSVGWVTINSGHNKTGGSTVTFTVNSNPDCSSRIGILTIAGKNFTVTQAASNASSFADGAFSGLLTDGSSKGVGSFTLRKRNERFSGKISLVGQSISFSGQFDAAGDANVLLQRRDADPLVLQLRQEPCNPNQITGALKDDAALFGITADRAVYNSRTNPAPLAGKYTIAIVGIEGQFFCPDGIGSAAINVLANGAIRIKGTLGDGVNFSQASFLSKEGTWPLYVPLYRKAGLIAGSLRFSGNTAETAPEGNLSWSKPSNTFDKLYAAGFSNTVSVLGSPYRLPVISTESALGFSEGVFILSGGDLSDGLAKDVMLMPNNKVVPILPGDDRLNFRISKNTGLFNGSVRLPGIDGTVKFKGSLLQNQNASLGLFLGTDQTGQVLLEPRL